MRIPLVSRLSFLLAGVAVAALAISGFLWYGAAQAPYAPYTAAHHHRCGEPVSMRIEDYDLLGGTRPGDDIELARVDFCDPVHVDLRSGETRVWFWLDVTITGQVYPYAGWGYPWVDVETPFPADIREPRNPWWKADDTLRILPNTLGYPGGDGVPCPLVEAAAWGLDLFFFRDAGFQLPQGTHHQGWVCVAFDPQYGAPTAFTIWLQPWRARITQWVEKLFVVQDEGLYDEPLLPAVDEDDFCAYAQQTHPASVRPGEGCARES